jgi:hypothetical protein
MAEHCPKHDITGAPCWCCEEQELNKKGPEAREAAYSDPEFLAKRGGADVKAVVVSKAMNRLAQLKPEALENLIALAEGRPLKTSHTGRTVVHSA